VIFTHKPAYTSPTNHAESDDLQDNFHPLFDQYGVDLVLTGHNHNYQRSYPLKSGEIIETTEKINYNDPEGQIYIVAGTGSVSQYGLDGRSSFIATRDDDNFGYLDVAITNDGKTLTGKFFANSGSTLDTFTIDKSGEAPLLEPEPEPSPSGTPKPDPDGKRFLQSVLTYVRISEKTNKNIYKSKNGKTPMRRSSM
jgi:hypothetical protein